MCLQKLLFSHFSFALFSTYLSLCLLFSFFLPPAVTVLCPLSVTVLPRRPCAHLTARQLSSWLPVASLLLPLAPAPTTCLLAAPPRGLLSCRVASATHSLVHDHPRLAPPLVEIDCGGNVPEGGKQLGQANHGRLTQPVACSRIIAHQEGVPLNLIAARGRHPVRGKARPVAFSCRLAFCLSPPQWVRIFASSRLQPYCA